MNELENGVAEGTEVAEVKSGKGVPRTAEQKEKQKESMKTRWADPAYREAVAAGRAKAKEAKLAATSVDVAPATATEVEG